MIWPPSTAATRPSICDGADAELGGVGDQVDGELVDGGLGGFADDGFWKLLEPKSTLPPPKPCQLPPPPSIEVEERLDWPDALGNGQNLAGVDIDDAGIDGDVGLGVGVAEAAQAVAMPAAASAAHVLSSWSRCRTR